MEQAHSASNPTYARGLLETSNDQSFLNGVWSQDHDAELSIPVEPMVPFGRQYLEPRQSGRGCDVNPDVETHPANQSVSAAVNLANTPMADYKNASDEHLLVTARFSDEQAFVELTSRYAKMVYGKVFRILRNREDAEDVVQEALYKAYVNLGNFRGTCAFSTWLTRIAINSALMLIRKRRSRREVSFDQPDDETQAWGSMEFADPTPNAEQAFTRRQTIDMLSHAVERLPSYYRCIIEQCHGRERSMKEAADTLGITLAAAKSRLMRARLRIRSTLENSASPWLRPTATQRKG